MPLSVGAGAILHPGATVRVAQNIAQCDAECFGIRKGDEDASPLGQQFLGVPERRADHRLSIAERVGERAGRDLLAVEVGDQADVRGGERAGDPVEFGEFVVEPHVVGHPQIGRQLGQWLAVGLPLLRANVRVRGAQNEIHRVGDVADDGRQGADRGLDALVG